MYYRKKPENHEKTGKNRTKSSKIELCSIENVENLFQQFLRTKRSYGAVDKTITSYSEHFKAAAKHFDIKKILTNSPEQTWKT